MNARFLILCGVVSLFASVALGAGEYQRARDGKTFVWNAEPKPGDEAIWSGDRDSDGYAKGTGTLTWITARGTVYARYFGFMVHGKFNGAVNAHSKGKTAHATFADGERTSPWTAGPASSRKEDQLQAAVPEAKPKTSPIAQTQPKPAVEAPAAPLPTPLPRKTETPVEKPVINHALPAENDQPTKSIASKPPPKAKPNESFDSSLSELVGPPSTLHNIPTNTQLSQQEATDLADAEARAQGYDLNEFQRPKADYSAATEKWTLFYDQKSSDGSPQAGRYFVATVEDKTKKVSLERKSDDMQQN